MKIKILICVLILIFTISFASASNLENVGFNISSEFKPIDDAAGLQFMDESNEIRIRIFDDEIDKWNDGYSKYNNTVYVSNSSLGGDEIVANDEVIGTMPTTILFSYGEYIKINGVTYWVEISSDNLQNPNYDKCLEDLEYFNEHNKFDSVDV